MEHAQRSSARPTTKTRCEISRMHLLRFKYEAGSQPLITHDVCRLGRAGARKAAPRVQVPARRRRVRRWPWSGVAPSCELAKPVRECGPEQRRQHARWCYSLCRGRHGRATCSDEQCRHATWHPRHVHKAPVVDRGFGLRKRRRWKQQGYGRHTYRVQIRSRATDYKACNKQGVRGFGNWSHLQQTACGCRSQRRGFHRLGN